MLFFKACGACVVALGVASLALTPLESPDEASCVEWKYPDSDACGALKGKTECKAKPTIEASDDEKKKADCKPTKGDDCFCD